MARTNVQTAEIALGGMTCSHCVATVREALLGVDGVLEAAVDLTSQSAVVEYDPSAASLANMSAAVAAAGYGSKPSDGLALSSPAQPERQQTEDIVLRIEGMTCASCVRSVEQAAIQVPGVQSCEVNLVEATARVRFEPTASTVENLLGVIAAAGYRAAIEGERSSGTDFDQVPSALVRRLAVSAALTLPLLVIAMAHGRLDFEGSAWVQFALATPVVLYGGAPFFIGAGKAGRRGRCDMNTLIAVGTGTSFLYSVIALVAPSGSSPHGTSPVYFETAGAIITLVLLGRYLESGARRRTSASIRKLVALQPDSVHVRREGVEIEIPLEQVAVGDEVLVRPGQRIPVDGTVIEGAGAVDESPITGESVPADKQPTSRVVSGSLNQDGFLVLRAESVGSETSLARIIEFVRRAQSSKAPAARLADRIAAVFVPVILLCAAATFLAWLVFGTAGNGLQMAVNNAVSVLIIACPCALGLATPAALAVGIGRAAEKGILIRDGSVLEAAREIDTVVFDKTGTLTLGRFAVTDVETFGALSEEELIAKAGALEARSEHPIAQAIAAKTRDSGSEVTNYRALPGAGASACMDGEDWLLGRQDLLASRGIEVSPAEPLIERLAKEGKSVVLFARNETLVGVLGLRDTIRPEAPEAMAALRRRGMRTLLLSGDSANAAKAARAGNRHRRGAGASPAAREVGRHPGPPGKRTRGGDGR